MTCLLDHKTGALSIQIFLDKLLQKFNIYHFSRQGNDFLWRLTMYAVVATGGKQYRVEAGEILRVEKLAGEVGADVAFERVLMLTDGETVRIGQPFVEGASVKGHIVEQGKHKKITRFQVQTP
jgi:large subunit ribosomal protein L21